MSERISHKEFVLRAIDKLATVREDGTKHKGIHSVFSGFNNAIKTYYGLKTTEEVIAITKKLEEEQVISVTPAKKGVMIYKYGDITKSNVENVLDKMGL